MGYVYLLYFQRQSGTDKSLAFDVEKWHKFTIGFIFLLSYFQRKYSWAGVQIPLSLSPHTFHSPARALCYLYSIYGIKCASVYLKRKSQQHNLTSLTHIKLGKNHNQEKGTWCWVLLFLPLYFYFLFVHFILQPHVQRAHRELFEIHIFLLEWHVLEFILMCGATRRRQGHCLLTSG